MRVLLLAELHRLHGAGLVRLDSQNRERGTDEDDLALLVQHELDLVRQVLLPYSELHRLALLMLKDYKGFLLEIHDLASVDGGHNARIGARASLFFKSVELNAQGHLLTVAPDPIRKRISIFFTVEGRHECVQLLQRAFVALCDLLILRDCQLERRLVVFLVRVLPGLLQVVCEHFLVLCLILTIDF